MLEMWQTGTPALRVSAEPATGLPQTAETSETPRAGRGENAGRIPLGVREWQKPSQTSRSERQWEQFILPLTNRINQLLETELTSEVHPDIGVEHTAPPPEKLHLQRS